MELKILALDTSTEMCSVALCDQNQITQIEQFCPREHAQMILPLIDQLLQDANISLNELDAIAVGAGPGSFTGVRIGVSVAQGLAFGANVPILPCSTLKALAQGVYRLTGAESVLTAIDARMNEVYWGQFKRQSEGKWQIIGSECVISPEKVLLNNLDNTTWFAAGTGFDVYPFLLEKQNISKSELLYPLAQDILALACVDFIENKVEKNFAIEPIYLRNDVARKKS